MLHYLKLTSTLILLFVFFAMNKYPSQTLTPIYSYPVVHQYPPPSYYYPYNEQPSTSVLLPVSYTSVPQDRHSSAVQYYDDEEAYLLENYRYHQQQQQQQRNHPHQSSYGQYANNPRLTRAPKNSSHSQSALLVNENAIRSMIPRQERSDYETKTTMNDNEPRDHGVIKRDSNRTTNLPYKSLTAADLLAKTHSEIRQEFRKMANPPAKDTHAARDERNVDKSRYRDVLPGEATRVRLQPDGDEKHDFINANYVSGHNNHEKAYIFTQGPLQTTVKDFWRMVWQENIAIIVMTTNVRESGMMKCFPYWPTDTRAVMNAGPYQIQNERSEKFDSFVITILSLRKRDHPETRIVYHAHYLKWPDHGIPSTTADALLFLNKVEQYRQSTMTQAPILLHCSAGIGRTGTFCAIDIGIKRYLEKQYIDIPSTVHKMRTERAGSVQTEDQYLFAYLAMMDYIRQQQALQERVNEPITASDLQIVDVPHSMKLRDFDVDNNIPQTLRIKSNGKKSTDLEQLTTLSIVNADQWNLLQEPTSHRGKTLSDSSVSAVQYVIPSTSTFQTVPSRQRSATEHISSMSATPGNTHHKKARK